MPVSLWWTKMPVHNSAHLGICWLHHALQVDINACGSAPGVILYQTHDDGMDAIMSYASRSLTKPEIHYPAHKLEFLTLWWAVVEKIHKYIYGLIFEIYTDNNLLMYMLTMAKLDAMSHWLVASLANYHFQLCYRAGKANMNADGLCTGPDVWPILWKPTIKSPVQQFKSCRKSLSKAL